MVKVNYSPCILGIKGYPQGVFLILPCFLGIEVCRRQGRKKRNCRIDSPEKHGFRVIADFFIYLYFQSINTSFLAQKIAILWKMTILQVLLRLLPTHSCVIYIVYSFNIAYERGMVVVVLPQVICF